MDGNISSLDSVTTIDYSEEDDWAQLQSTCDGIESVDLVAGKTGYLIGRHEECDVIEVLVNPDGNVGTAFIEDLSTHGTWVNSVRLEKGKRRQLIDGDIIQLTKSAHDKFQN
ncbi:hypothetical protein HK100_010266, partial [Physocladia obscura]